MYDPKPKKGDLKFETMRAGFVHMGLSIGIKFLYVGQSVLFARLFSPDEIGSFGTATLTISFFLIFSQMGVDQSLVRQKDPPAELMNTALTVNFVLGLILFLLTQIAASHIAAFFRNPELEGYVRLLSVVSFNATLSLPGVIWVRNLQFGISKIPALVEIVVSIAVAYALYRSDFGTWSLVIGRGAGFLAMGGTLWFLAPSTPRFGWNAEHAKGMLHFGWPLLINGVCSYFVWQGDSILVRYFFGGERLGFYLLAYSLPLYMKELADMTGSPLYPAFARVQDDQAKLAEAFRQSNRYIASVVAPVGVGMFFFSSEIIHFVYTAKWAPAIPLLRILALSVTISICTGYNWGIIALAKGKTRYLMYVNLANVSYLFTVGWFMVTRYGVEGAAYFNLSQVLLTLLLARIPIIYRELGTIDYLLETWKPLLSALASGLASLLVFRNLPSGIFWFAGEILLYASLFLMTFSFFDKMLLLEIAGFLKRILARLEPDKEGAK